MAWQLQEAKQRFSEVVRRALDEGPQLVTRRGEAAVVVVAAREFESRWGDRADFKEFLRQAPDLGRLRIARERRPARKAEL